MELTIQARGAGFDLSSAESYPAGVTLYRLPMQQIADNPWNSAFSLTTDQKRTILYYALLPEAKGSYVLESGISHSLEGVSHQRKAGRAWPAFLYHFRRLR